MRRPRISPYSSTNVTQLSNELIWIQEKGTISICFPANHNNLLQKLNQFVFQISDCKLILD